MFSGISDEEYVSAGAKIIDDAAGVWKAADLIIKVKEPIASEYALLRRDQILFTYFSKEGQKHLQSNR